MERRIAALLEKRLAELGRAVIKLERAVVKFKQHRQAWINLNEQLKIMKRETDAAS